MDVEIAILVAVATVSIALTWVVTWRSNRRRKRVLENLRRAMPPEPPSPDASSLNLRFLATHQATMGASPAVNERERRATCYCDEPGDPKTGLAARSLCHPRWVGDDRTAGDASLGCISSSQ